MYNFFGKTLQIVKLVEVARGNLNRDENGSPKSHGVYGNTRNLVPSECWKRATREWIEKNCGGRTVFRSACVPAFVHAELIKMGKDAKEAEAIVRWVFNNTFFPMAKEKGDLKTKNEMFSTFVVKPLADAINTDWTALETSLKAKPKPKENEREKENKGKKDVESLKAMGANDVYKIFKDIADRKDCLNDGFFIPMDARFIPNCHSGTVVAARKTSGAMSVNEMEIQYNFRTLQDDLAPNDGAVHLGTDEYSSAVCLFFDDVFDGVQYFDNIRNIDPALPNQYYLDQTKKAIETYLKACILALPTAKQSVTNTATSPSYVAVVVRDNIKSKNLYMKAFAQPVEIDNPKQSLVKEAAKRWEEAWKDYQETSMFPDEKCEIFVFSSNPAFKEFTHESIKDIAKVYGLGNGAIHKNISVFIRDIMDCFTK